MSIDKFGRTLSTAREGYSITRSPLPLTASGDYDIQGKKLSNIGLPVDGADCAIKKYVDSIRQQVTEMVVKAQQQQIADRDFKFNQMQEELMSANTDIKEMKMKLAEVIRSAEIDQQNIADISGNVITVAEDIRVQVNQNRQDILDLIKSTKDKFESIQSKIGWLDDDDNMISRLGATIKNLETNYSTRIEALEQQQTTAS